MTQATSHILSSDNKPIWGNEVPVLRNHRVMMRSFCKEFYGQSDIAEMNELKDKEVIRTFLEEICRQTYIQSNDVVINSEYGL